MPVIRSQCFLHVQGVVVGPLLRPSTYLPVKQPWPVRSTQNILCPSVRQVRWHTVHPANPGTIRGTCVCFWPGHRPPGTSSDPDLRILSNAVTQPCSRCTRRPVIARNCPLPIRSTASPLAISSVYGSHES